MKRMEQPSLSVLRREEQITLQLRALYEQYGYRKYRMGKFEEYELYLENKNFLKSKHILTFHDLDGKVLALKPDVTLSIAKNTHATASSSEKFYYLENVYRLDKPSGDYREISQLGLEQIGRLDGLASYEVIGLAQKTLAAIHDRRQMQISHMGFWVSLLDETGAEFNTRKEWLDCISGKKLHELKDRLTETNLPSENAGILLKAAGLCGPFGETLKAARDLARNDGMTKALDELENVHRLLTARGLSDHVTLDFSLVDDSDYYGGLIFQGYVESVPRPVLAGGYYGNLLKKFGRDLDAIGFAVYLNELSFLFRADHGSGVDALILYDVDADKEDLLHQAEEMRAKGMRVRLERSVPDEIRCGKISRFTKDGLKEAGKDA